MKAGSAKIARRYAKAMLSLTDERGDGAQVRLDLDQVAAVLEAAKEHGAQHATAVHRERGQQVEQQHHGVRDEQPLGQSALEPVLDADGDADVAQRHDAEDGEHEHEIHGRAREGDDQLLPRGLRHALELRHASDAGERDDAGADAEATSRECVPELVQQHAGEHEPEQAGHQQHVREAVGAAEREERDDQEEARLDLDADAEDRGDGERPAHAVGVLSELQSRTAARRASRRRPHPLGCGLGRHDAGATLRRRGPRGRPTRRRHRPARSRERRRRTPSARHPR